MLWVCYLVDATIDVAEFVMLPMPLVLPTVLTQPAFSAGKLAKWEVCKTDGSKSH